MLYCTTYFNKVMICCHPDFSQDTGTFSKDVFPLAIFGYSWVKLLDSNGFHFADLTAERLSILTGSNQLR